MTYPSPHFVGFFLQSKGGILSKACDYIQELRQSNHRLSEELQGLDQLQLDNDVLRQQVESRPQCSPCGPTASGPVGDAALGCHLLPVRGGHPRKLGTWLCHASTSPLSASFSWQVEDLKNKNLLLRAQLRHHGVEVVIKSDSN